MFSRYLSYLFLLLTSLSLLTASELVWDRMEAHIEMEPEQKEARASFTVSNQGSEAVRIADVKTSCGCTGSIIDRKLIEPGESAEIVGTFHRGKRQGLNRNRLQVFLDKQSEPVATLVMSVKIPNLIEALPQFVYWSKSSSKSERRIRIKMDRRYINKIVNIDYDETRLMVKEATSQPGIDADLVLVVEPIDYKTLFRGTIGVEGVGPNGRSHTTNLHVFVQP